MSGSFVTLADVKVALVTNDIDDARVELAIDDAEDEVLMFLQLDGADLLTALEEQATTSDSFQPGGDDGNFRAIRRAVILLVQTMVDPMPVEEIERLRRVAYEVMRPYRKRIGA
jgi:hypothetical protein